VDGQGPGAVTADGCPVEVYRLLPTLGEPELIDAWAGPETSVLDLGAGVGRIADPLVELGHDVLAVDDSAEMLRHVRRARTHLGGIVGLALDERFDVVLLASHLVNTPDGELRQGLLDAAARHLAPGGELLVQWHPPGWFAGLRAGDVRDGGIGPVRSRFTVSALTDGLLTAEIHYTDGRSAWTQRFQARQLDRPALRVSLAGAGLREVPLTPADPAWFAAAPA
jgi:SAM-dependent methyltransferase